MALPTIEELLPWIEVRFDRASGPGGQNVNKVATRAALLFDFRGCPLLGESAPGRIAECYATRLTQDGRLRVVAQRERTQGANRAIAERRLLELLESALHTPTPRRPTRPTRSSQRYRVADKRRRGDIKRQRRRGPESD